MSGYVVDELKRLYDSISYEARGTSREERIKIMQAASDALAQHSGASDVDLLLDLLPDCTTLQVTIDCDRKVFIDGDCGARGFGATLFEALQFMIRKRLVTVSKIQEYGGAEADIEDVVPAEVLTDIDRAAHGVAPPKSGGGFAKVTVDGVEYPNKKTALNAIFDRDKETIFPTPPARYVESAAAAVGCTDGYAFQIYSQWLMFAELDE